MGKKERWERDGEQVALHESKNVCQHRGEGHITWLSSSLLFLVSGMFGTLGIFGSWVWAVH